MRLWRWIGSNLSSLRTEEEILLGACCRLRRKKIKSDLYGLWLVATAKPRGKKGHAAVVGKRGGGRRNWIGATLP